MGQKGEVSGTNRINKSRDEGRGLLSSPKCCWDLRPAFPISGEIVAGWRHKFAIFVVLSTPTMISSNDAPICAKSHFLPPRYSRGRTGGCCRRFDTVCFDDLDPRWWRALETDQNRLAACVFVECRSSLGIVRSSSSIRDVLNPSRLLSSSKSARQLINPLCDPDYYNWIKMSTSASFNQEFRTETWTLYSVGMYLVLTRL